MTIADRLKELRGKRGLSQKDLAKKSGVSDGMIGSIENGSRNPSKKTIEKLSKVLEVTPYYLENGEEKNDSLIEDFIQQLINNGVIKDATNIPDEVKEMILRAVETQIFVLLNKK